MQEFRVRPLGGVTPIRAAIGAVALVILAIVVVNLLSEAHHTRSTLDTLRSARPVLVAAAVFAEAASYIATALVLALLAPRLRPLTSLRIAMAALGTGSLLPGQPVGSLAVTIRELTRRGIPGRRATQIAIVALVGVSASSMALLAGPTLVLSAIWAPLPSGWRGLVAFFGAIALVLGALIVAAVVRPRLLARMGRGRVQDALAAPSSGRLRAQLVLLGIASWIADATCLWLIADSLGIRLPLATLPMAYVTGAVVIAIPILPGGLGGVEAAVPLVLATGHMRVGDALLAVLAWRALSFWLPAVVGLLCLASLGRGVTSGESATGSDRPRPTGSDEPAGSR
jgi:uncharacterized membrane protein YbhN (UPF0104 family)